jgi:predicted ester cyclase
MSTGSPDASESAALVEANTALVVRYFLQSHNAPHDFDVIDELLEPAYAERQKRSLAMEAAAFPDERCTVEDVVAAGDKVVLRFSISGTHLGELRLRDWVIPPTGRRGTVKGIVIYEVEGDKIVRQWFGEDVLSLLLDLGATLTLPEPRVP